MSKKHQKVLDSIYSDHPSSNIHWREIESLMLHLGAEIREGTGATTVIILNGQEFPVHHGKHNATIGKSTLHQLKKFLISVGITH